MSFAEWVKCSKKFSELARRLVSSGMKPDLEETCRAAYKAGERKGFDMRELLDEDGENCAVRSFLTGYGQQGSVARMKLHMDACGFPFWPAWVEDPDDQGRLTKGGAQDWLRHLFAMENTNAKVRGCAECDSLPGQYPALDSLVDTP